MAAATPGCPNTHTQIFICGAVQAEAGLTGIFA